MKLRTTRGEYNGSTTIQALLIIPAFCQHMFLETKVPIAEKPTAVTECETMLAVNCSVLGAQLARNALETIHLEHGLGAGIRPITSRIATISHGRTEN